MSVRERILSIRLLNKVSKHPMYAKALGIEGVQAKIRTGDSTYSETTGLSRKP
ncbi:hypothetical protein ACTQ34_14345 [Agathobaculum sp. LCP25S3_E8]|uniref:hypothetical protein n=1 Tax=Agathobaculum sp. LCP25S3_E8 TaxID=3438735 RepID=UPI003F9259B5